MDVKNNYWRDLKVIYRSTCSKNCPDTCCLLTHVKDNRIVKVEGDSTHPITRGFLCSKGYMFKEQVYSRERILYPMKRIGRKGEGKFKRISWESAYTIIVKKLKEVKKHYGSEAVLPYSYSGTMGIVNRYFPYRFFNRYGASRLEGDLCDAAGATALQYVYGTTVGMDPLDFLNSKVIVLWGKNAAWTNLHGFRIVQEAREKNEAKVVVIDPIKTFTASKADIHLQPYPGTDSALALGMMNVIISKKLYDKEFIEKHTTGFDRLTERVKSFTPDEVEKITQVPSSQIIEVAELYAKRKPVALQIGAGMQRNINGGEMIRAISCLPALTGNLGFKGAGFLYSNGAFWELNFDKITGKHLAPKIKRRSINMVQLGEALLDRNIKPPIKFLFIYNSNPAAVCPNQTKVREGLSRRDLFTVVHEIFQTDTVDYADIVLPATSFFEQLDIHFPYFGLYVAINEKAIDPLGESKSNIDLFRELAKRMGYTDKPLLQSAEEVIHFILKNKIIVSKGITLERLKSEGFVLITTPEAPYVAFRDKKFRTPSGKIEFYSKKAKEDGHDPLPNFIPIKKDGKYSIRLLSPSCKYLIHSQFHNTRRIRELLEYPVLEISKEDCEKRGIKNDDWVIVENERGNCLLKVKLSKSVKKGVAVTYNAFWPKLSPDHKNVNFTTPDCLADMGGNSTFHTNFVKIKKL